MERERSRPSWLWTSLAVALAAILVGVVVLVLTTGEDREDSGETLVVEDDSLTIASVAENAGELFGRRVTVAGEVDEVVVAPGAFTLEGRGGNRVLVVPRAGTLLPPVAEGDEIVATGIVHPIDEPGLEDAIDRELRIDFDQPPFDPYSGLPVVLAGDVDEIARGG